MSHLDDQEDAGPARKIARASDEDEDFVANRDHILHTQSFAYMIQRNLHWRDQMAFALGDSVLFRKAVEHPYVALAQQYYNNASDGSRLTRAQAAQMLVAARERGSELVEVALLHNRQSLCTPRLKYHELLDMRLVGMFNCPGVKFGNWWGSAAHHDVVRAVTWSRGRLPVDSSPRQPGPDGSASRVLMISDDANGRFAAIELTTRTAVTTC